MQAGKTPEERVLERFFQKLADDPTLPKQALERLMQAWEHDRLADGKEILEACRLAGEADAADITP
jgi:hypothetical protein